MILLISLFVHLVALAEDSNAACCGDATYTATFQGTWSSRTHPKDFPSSAHWSGVVGGSHHSNYKMWKPDEFASPGVKVVAETGSQGLLVQEMTAAGKSVLDIVRWSSIGSGVGTRSGQLRVDQNHSLVSLITMIAPSPDWFVGVRDLDLCKGTEWVESLSLDVLPYDSGTDSGLKFKSPNQRTSPSERIHRLTGTFPNTEQSSFHGYNPVPKMGNFTFTRKSTTGGCPCCSGSLVFVVDFKAAWSPFRHPDVYVERSHWSKLVGISHSCKYSVWKPDEMATVGVKTIAEKGVPGALFKELKKAQNDGSVLQYVRGNGVANGIGQVSLKLKVDAEHSCITVLAMAGPSPDWFTGIHDVNVCLGCNGWLDKPKEISAWLYDAGTDSGTELTSPDSPTMPQQPITRIAQPSFGTFTVLQMSPDTSKFLRSSKSQQKKLNSCVRLVEGHSSNMKG